MRLDLTFKNMFWQQRSLWLFVRVLYVSYSNSSMQTLISTGCSFEQSHLTCGNGSTKVQRVRSVRDSRPSTAAIILVESYR